MHGGCVKKMPHRIEGRPGSGCRADCLHRSAVEEYREAKTASDEHRKIERERACNGYATESAAWDADHPPWTFRDFLVSRRRERLVCVICGEPEGSLYARTCCEENLQPY